MKERKINRGKRGKNPCDLLAVKNWILTGWSRSRIWSFVVKTVFVKDQPNNRRQKEKRKKEKSNLEKGLPPCSWHCATLL
jgi:hypothetical protein